MRKSAFGYIGELRALKECIGYILRKLGWSYTLNEIFMGDAESAQRCQALDRDARPLFR